MLHYMDFTHKNQNIKIRPKSGHTISFLLIPEIVVQKN